MRVQEVLCKICYVLTLLFTCTPGDAFAGTVWYFCSPGSNTMISTQNFNFNGFASTSAASNVDSVAATFRFIWANNNAVCVQIAANSGSIAITKPSGCTIGSSSVSATNTVLMVNSVEQGASFTLSSSDSAINSMFLRFKAAGNHGLSTGTVSCTTGGTLTITY